MQENRHAIQETETASKVVVPYGPAIKMPQTGGRLERNLVVATPTLRLENGLVVYGRIERRSAGR